MSNNVANFTRGSQLFETFGLLFAAGLKPIFWVIGITLTISIGLSLGLRTHSGDGYLFMMRELAAAWHWMQFGTDKTVQLHTASIAEITMPMNRVADYLPVQEAWARITGLLRQGVIRGAVIALPACFAYAFYARRFGVKAAARKHERGALLVTRPALEALVNAYNQRVGNEDRKRDYRAIFGAGWALKAPLATPAELVAEGMYLPYTIGGLSYPWRSEQTHTMIVGTTGTGKSTVMKDLVRQARARGERVVLFDLTGTFIEAFYNPTTDIILNPFDARCPHWSLFHDASSKPEFTSAAEALVPHDGGAAEPFWVQAARLLFVEVCQELQAEGRGTNEALYDELMTAPLKHLHKLVEHTVAGPLTDTDAKRMAESVRAVFNTNATALECLPNDGKHFSIRRWITDEDCPGGSILFVAAQYAHLSTVRSLLTLWLNTAVKTLMTMPASPRRLRMWFMFDELGALHRIPAIEEGMQTARNFGGAFVLGVHTIAKLHDTYGKDIADTLGSLARTKLTLATPDYGSAKWCSDFIGSSEWRQMDQGVSYGHNNVRDAVTLTPRRQLEPLVIPDTIMNLPSLSGYIKFPEGLPAALIKLVPVNYDQTATGFIARAPTPPKHRVREEPEDEGGDDGGRGNAADIERAKGKGAGSQDRTKPNKLSEVEKRTRMILKAANDASPKDREQVIAAALGPAAVSDAAATSGLPGPAAAVERAASGQAPTSSQDAMPTSVSTTRKSEDAGNENAIGQVDRRADNPLQALYERRGRDDQSTDLTIVEARQDFGDGRGQSHSHGDHEVEHDGMER